MTEQDEIRPPGLVRSSAWLMTAGAVALVASTALLFTVRDAMVNAVRQASTGKQLDAAQVSSVTDKVLWTLLIVSVLLAGAMAWASWQARNGARRYRTVATVVLVLTVLFVLFTGSLFQLAATVLLVLGLVLLYLPASNEYFRPTRTSGQ